MYKTLGPNCRLSATRKKITHDLLSCSKGRLGKNSVPGGGRRSCAEDAASTLTEVPSYLVQTRAMLLHE